MVFRFFLILAFAAAPIQADEKAGGGPSAIRAAKCRRPAVKLITDRRAATRRIAGTPARHFAHEISDRGPEGTKTAPAPKT